MHSKHLDKFKPGDRLSTCFGKMKPIALTYKVENKRYENNNPYKEIMIVHICTNCLSVSKNRIAGDDNNYNLYEIWKSSLTLNGDILNYIKKQNIEILGEEYSELLTKQLL